MERTLIGAINDLSAKLDVSVNRISDALGDMSSWMGGASSSLPVYKDAVTDQREEVILCYTVGTLEFVDAKSPKGKTLRYGLLDMELFNLDGVLNGRYEVVWKPNPDIPPSEYVNRPKEYSGPFDRIVKPEPIPDIPTFPLRAGSRASYRFDGHGESRRGTLFATGPANLLLTPFKDGSAIFQVSVCAFVTGGTGEYEDASGVNTALGSSFVPKGVDIGSLPAGQKIPGVTVSTFRIVRKANIA